jgi:serine/threonine protein phosphatase PrpC
MKTYHLSTIGAFHTNHNEDYFLIHEIGKDKLLLAVMDGCTMGTDSYLAATIIGKLLRKIAKETHYKAFIQKTNHHEQDILEETMRQLFAALKTTQQHLDLQTDELLSTILLAIFNRETHAAAIIIIGDGVICCNGRIIEYEQDNKPDYIGYHLHENFEEWYANHTQYLTLHHIRDLSLATDGIFSFQKFDNHDYTPISDTALAELLLIQTAYSDNENKLQKTLIDIAKKYGKKPSDDLTVVRLVIGDW